MQTQDAAAPVAGKAVLTVALCCLVAMMEGVDLQAPGLTTPALGALFHMTPGDKGNFAAMSTYGLLIAAPIGGRLSDLIGRKWVLILSAAFFGVFSILTALSTSVGMLMAMRFLTGIGLGGALPNLIALAADTVTPARRHTAIGFLYASLPTGGGTASLISAFAQKPDQWPLVYWIGGIAPLVVVPILMLALPRTPPAVAAAGAARKDVLGALFGEGRARRTLLLWAGFFSALLIMYLLLGWLPSLMRARGLTGFQAALVQVGFNWFGALGSVLTGLILDRGKRPITVAVVFVATTAALAYLAGAPAAFTMALLAGSLVGFTISGTQAVLYSLAPSCYPAHVRGTGVGFAVGAGRLGSALGPQLGAVLLTAGRSADQVLMALVPIIIFSAVVSILVAILASRRTVEAVAA